MFHVEQCKTCGKSPVEVLDWKYGGGWCNKCVTAAIDQVLSIGLEDPSASDPANPVRLQSPPPHP